MMRKKCRFFSFLTSLLDFSWGNVFDHIMCWFWMQMTDARCSRCSQIKVGLRDIIQAGHGDRYQVLMLFHITSVPILGYIHHDLLLLLCISININNHILISVLWIQLECIACGHSWYASRDEVSTLTIDSEKPAQGTESEDVEKNLTSPREAEKKAKQDESLKTTNDSNVNNNPETTKKPE